MLLFLYLTTAVAGFLSPYEKASRDAAYLLAPPQRVRLFHDGRLIGPFVYSLERTRDPDTVLHMHSHPAAVDGADRGAATQWPALQVYFGITSPWRCPT